jgi:hypothetical protein
MHNLRLRKSMASVFTLFLLLSFAGSGHGLVLCLGHDRHMHIEATFNGIDCGHFTPSTVKEDGHLYVTADSPFSTAPCYCCTDIPLSFPRYSFNQNGYRSNALNGKTAISTATIPSSSFLLSHRSVHPDGHLSVPIPDCGTLSQILSTSLRI